MRFPNTPTEYANGIPDIIDEALWEIDWWLRMREPLDGGYLTGITNIGPPQNENYAGAARAYQGWTVAAGCAMVADCFRLAGNTAKMNEYRDSAIAAYSWANGHSTAGNDLNKDVRGYSGKDFKFIAAAFLYNLTGNTLYENTMQELCQITGAASDPHTQQFGMMAYILTNRTPNNVTLQNNMRSSIINMAKSTVYCGKMNASPTKAARRSTNSDQAVQSRHEVDIIACAHRISTEESDRALFERALNSEAEWTLGRNPQMSLFFSKYLKKRVADGSGITGNRKK